MRDFIAEQLLKDNYRQFIVKGVLQGKKNKHYNLDSNTV